LRRKIVILLVMIFILAAPLITYNVHIRTTPNMVVNEHTLPINANEQKIQNFWVYSTDGNIYSSPAVADLDDNGVMDIVIGSYDGKVYAIRGDTGQLLWDYYAIGEIYSSPAIGFVDSDNFLDVVFGTAGGNSSRIVALKGSTGELIWSFNITTNFNITTKIHSSPAIDDIDADGDRDVVIGADNGIIYAINGFDGTLLWNYTTGSAIYSSPAIDDIDGDGRPEIIIGSDDGELYVLNGEDGSFLWSYDTGNSIRSSPVLADVDNDYNLDIIFGSDSGYVYALDGKSGNEKWTFYIGDPVKSSPAIGDVDRDLDLDIVVCSYAGGVYIIEGRSGSQLWSTNVGAGIASSPILVDVDYDRELEIIVTANDRMIYAVDYGNRTTLWDYPIGYTQAADFTSTPAAVNLDGDDGYELVVGSDDYNVYAIDISGYPGPGILSYWPCFRGEPAHRASQFRIDLDRDMISSNDELYFGSAIDSPDSDSDGMPDAWEIYHYLNPTDAGDAAEDLDRDDLSNLQEYYAGTDPYGWDTDRDGMPDGWEVEHSLNPLDPEDAKDDPDRDGLTNLDEYFHSTDPNNSDTDDDGYDDGYELENNSDPTDPESHPSEGPPPEFIVVVIIVVIISVTFIVIRRRKKSAVMIPGAEVKPSKMTKEEYYIEETKKLLKAYGEITLNELASRLKVKRKDLEPILVNAIAEDKLAAKIHDNKLIPVPEKAALPTVQEVQPAAAAAAETTLSIPGYKVLGLIGSGGFASVFKAKDPEGRIVALKILNVTDEKAKKTFIREVSLWKSLNHPNIVKLITYGADPIPYLVMELMDGTLRQQISKEKFDIARALNVVLEIAFALDYAHRDFMIVHRDIKPENILYKNGTYKLSDWGLGGVQTLISTTGYKGTVAYSAPEQFDASFGNVSQWTDVWQLGVVLYELVAGELPFGASIGETVRRVLYEEPKRPEGISDELWQLITDMLKKKPEERITVQEVIKRIRLLLGQ